MKLFKKTYIIIGISLILSTRFLSGCGYLKADEYLYELENLNDTWSDRLNIRRAWSACYGAMPNYSDMVSSWPFNCNYDEGHAGLDNYSCLLFAQGRMTSDAPLFQFWRNYYQAIRTCNMFLENYQKANDKLLVPGEVEGYAADARFLRAFYYSQMLELYGPFPIVDKTINYADTEVYPTKRNTQEECVTFLINELDTCIQQLPIVENILVTELGRPSKEAAMSVKARVLLWDASPLVNGNTNYNNFLNPDGQPYFKPGGADEQKWRKAAQAAKEIIDLNKFELVTVPAVNSGTAMTVPLGNFPERNVLWPNGPGGIDPYRSFKALFSGGKTYWNKEVLWQVNVPGQTSNLSVLGFPRNYNSGQAATITARVYATQKLVDAFFTNKGTTIEEENGKLYSDIGFSNVGDTFYIRGTGKVNQTPIITGFKVSNANQPVPTRTLNREARFYATIGFNGRGYQQNNGTLYYADYRANAVDGYLQSDRPSTRSGYPIVKWVADDDQSANGNSDKPYPVFRLAEIYLAYAEALNEFDPANPDIVKYLNLVRYRGGLPGYTIAAKEVNRERIKRERYVELAFEGKRYFDSRRWKDAEKVSKDIWNNSDGMGGVVYGCNYLFTYSRFFDRAPIDGYLFRNRDYFLPIPFQEVANYWGTLTQNPGW